VHRPSRTRGITWLVVAATLAAPVPVQAQGIQPADAAFWIVSGATLVGAWQLDGPLRRDDPTVRSPTADRLARAGYRLGGRDTLVPAFIAATTVTHLTGWPVESSRVATVVSGVAVAGVATEVIKAAVGRGRPRDVDDPHEFRPFTIGDNAWLSFPSGHAAAAFSVAAALTEEFELGLAEPVLWSLAGLVAWSRIYDDAHWASDTLAGALVGIVGARTTVAWLNRRAAAEAGGAEARARIGTPVVRFHVSLR
jgi:membrane-associated phospholipid phosphatase